MTNTNNNSHGLKIILNKVQNRTLELHNQKLLKTLINIDINSNYQLYLSGSLNKLPNYTIPIPNYNNKSLPPIDYQYQTIIKDPLGEKKIDNNGNLLNSRRFLFDTFKFSNNNNNINFVFIENLINCLKIDKTISEFIEQYPQLYFIKPTDDILTFFKKLNIISNDLINSLSDDQLKEKFQYITTRSAFIQFGAVTIGSGLRVIDDYWEQSIIAAKFNPQYRVHTIPDKIIKLLKTIKPKILYVNSNDNNNNKEIKEDDKIGFENPYSCVVEQQSEEVRLQYAESFSKGEPFDRVVIGQTIVGSLEITSQFRVPKYHSKNSFQQANSTNAMDKPIGIMVETINQHAATTTPQQGERGTNTITTSDDNITTTDVLNNNNDNTNINSGVTANNNLEDDDDNEKEKEKEKEKSIKSNTNDNLLSSTLNIFNKTDDNESLNVNGWKFDNLPLQNSKNPSKQLFSKKGLPLYNKTLVLPRIKKLTPNEIIEVERQHDSVILNTGLNFGRDIRNNRWLKYWQYKNGLPVGLKKKQIKEFKEDYFKELINKKISKTEFNVLTNTDEVTTSVRIPNANFIDNSNIRGKYPPYKINKNRSSED